MNDRNTADLILTAGKMVDITRHFDDGERHVNGLPVVPYAISVDCAASYFPKANPLIPLDGFAKRSGRPTSKGVIVSVRTAQHG